MKKFTVYLSPEMVRALRIAAAEEGVSATRLAASLIASSPRVEAHYRRITKGGK
jgi:predicted HicB family RNase H-like nuclease